MSTSERISESEQDQGNYPPLGDTTSEGGFGSLSGQSPPNVDPTMKFAPVSERGLVDQTTDGQPLGNEMEDAWQGTDEETTRTFREEQNNQPGSGKGSNPYGESLETRAEAEAALKAGATDARARTYQAEKL